MVYQRKTLGKGTSENTLQKTKFNVKNLGKWNGLQKTSQKTKFFGPKRKPKKLIAPTREFYYPKRRLIGKKRVTKALHARKINFYSKRWRLHRTGLARIPTYNTTLLQFRRDYDRVKMTHYITNFVDRHQRIKHRRLNCLSSSAQRKIKKLVRRQRILGIRGFRETVTRWRTCTRKERKFIPRRHLFKEFHQVRVKNQGAPLKSTKNRPRYHVYPKKHTLPESDKIHLN